mmetsp:Transcript_4161/g.10141  ORF Transcript_4161/g.10141 Transcript_4161/m.10141 type:complete len:202 (+) Transcript_4161:721-1326(+)
MLCTATMGPLPMLSFSSPLASTGCPASGSLFAIAAITSLVPLLSGQIPRRSLCSTFQFVSTTLPHTHRTISVSSFEYRSVWPQALHVTSFALQLFRFINVIMSGSGWVGGGRGPGRSLLLVLFSGCWAFPPAGAGSALLPPSPNSPARPPRKDRSEVWSAAVDSSEKAGWPLEVETWSPPGLGRVGAGAASSRPFTSCNLE